VDRPFAGFLLGRNRIVAPIGLSHWSGFRAEVPFGAELVAADGRDVESVPALVERTWELPVGTERRYAFATGAERVERTVPVMAFTRADYALLFGLWIVNGFLFLGLGFLVAALKPKRPASVATLAFGIAWGLTLLLSLGDFYRFHFRSLYAVAQAVAPAALVFLSLTFPDRPLPRRWPWVLGGFAALTAVHAGADIWLYERDPAAWYRFFDWSLVYMAACALASCVLLGRFYRRAPQEGRARLQVVAVGAFAAFGAPAAVQLTAMLAGVSLPLNLLPGLTGLFALAVGYAILRHDVLSLDPLLSRSVFYALFTTLVTVGYVALLGLASSYPDEPPGASAWMPFAFTAAAVAVVAPVRRGAQAIVDRLFFRSDYDLERTLEKLSGRLTGSLDAAEIARRIETTLAATVGPEPCLLLVPDGAGWLRETGAADSGAAARGVSAGIAIPASGGADPSRDAPSRFRLRSDDPRLAAPGSGADGAAAVISLSDEPRGGPTRAAGITLLVPLRADGVVEAVLALGPKRSGAPYSARDLGLLRTLANQAAIALRNAASYAALRDLSESLELRVSERTAALARTHEELLATQTHLARADKLASLGRLVAGVAHEINNPVAFVSSSVDLIRDAAVRVRERLGVDVDPALAAILDRLVQNADICQDGAQRAARIVRDLTAFSRTSQQEQPIDLNAALERTLQLLRGETRDRIRVVREYGDVPRPAGIAGEIDQVLMNLLANAVQAIDGAGEIRLRTWAENGSVYVRVSDDGPGVAEEIRERIFEPFFTTKDGQGSGLGLAISQAVLARHGGDLSLANAPGRGAAFTVRLPLGRERPGGGSR
jgi:two-component system NtrC family sensor kinase